MSSPPADEPATRRDRRERRKERRRDRAQDAADAGDSAGACDRFGGRRGGGSGCGCDDVCDCDLLLVLRLSTLLAAVAAVLPAGGSGRAVRAAIRGYRRRLSRFTPACPGNPSCSAYALTAVATLGPRHGLRAAARHIATCAAPLPPRGRSR